jgi:CheY-like chemotaxis protein
VVVDQSFVRQYPNVKTGPYVVLTVGDTGCGMSPDMLKRIFDPFYTTKEKGEGTGLGLAVVHGIVESHGGTVHVYSEPGTGSTFKVFLPAVEPRQASEESPTDQTIPRGSERILFLDDEPSIVNAASHILQGLGYDVTSSTSSEEALKAFADAPDGYDLVITDMTMPRMTGVRLAQNLMDIRPDIPIILCTGFTDLIDTAQSRAMGIRAMVTKPLLRHELAQTIRAVLDERRC